MNETVSISPYNDDYLPLNYIQIFIIVSRSVQLNISENIQRHKRSLVRGKKNISISQLIAKGDYLQ